MHQSTQPSHHRLRTLRDRLQRTLLLVGAILSLTACQGTGAPSVDTSDAQRQEDPPIDSFEIQLNPSALCDGPSQALWLPEHPEDEPYFPDDYFTVDDPDSPTGQRVEIIEKTTPWLDGLDPTIRSAYLGLEGLTGWGTLAPVALHFSAPLNTVAESANESLVTQGIQLWALTEDGATRIPYSTQLLDEDRAVLLWPLVPLQASTLHAVVVTRDQTDDTGACYAPPPALIDLLSAKGEDMTSLRMRDRYKTLFKGTGIAPDEVSLAIVFTTQDTLHDALAIAEDISTRDYQWLEHPKCDGDGEIIHCEQRFIAWDYRVDGSISEPVPQAPWELQVSSWQPAQGTGPWPTIVAGHGMNGNRSVGGELAEVLVPMGLNIVAMDALHHGDHPSVVGNDSIVEAMRFLGIEPSTLELNGRVLRDNFRQSGFDRLQMMQILIHQGDLNGDGTRDVDQDRMAYIGGSLGGIMGAQLLALSPHFSAAALLVPGARLTAMITDAAQTGVFTELIADFAGSTGGMWRTMAVIQAIIDPGDPAAFASHVLKSRFDNRQAPHLLLTMALDDDTVPNLTTAALARALEVPIFGPMVMPIELVGTEDGFDLAGNLNAGQTTAGLFQFDRITSDGLSKPASHANTIMSPEGILQLAHFLDTWLHQLQPEIIDPYHTLNTPPL